MGNLAVINIVGLSPLARRGVLGGPSALERVLNWAHGLPGVEAVVLLAGDEDEAPEGMKVLRRESWSQSVLVEALSEASEGCEALFYAWGDCPLLDSDVSAKLWELHSRYDAEYTFADGYPHGLASEILSSTLPARLKPLASGDPLERDSLFAIISKDINAFDVETDISPKDLRMERLALRCDSRRNLIIMENLFAAGGVDAASLMDIIPKNRSLLRGLPAYFPIQVTDRCPQSCSYCPFPKQVGDPRKGNNFMDAERFRGLCRRLMDFAGDGVISPSLWGEPALHPEIGNLIHAALDAGESRVLIETSGLGWDEALLESLAASVEAGRLMWILSLDAADRELYHRLRGEGQKEAEATARRLKELFGNQVWVQAVRMNENEEHLEDFHRKWTQESFKVIIQKYNSWAGYLPERQPADLSPLMRFPCWHLKRDFPVLIDGSVPVCREDLGRRNILGNVFDQDPAEIWAAGEALHEEHVADRYPPLCASCDEYYTFNF